jgi:hypothetical protein
MTKALEQNVRRRAMFRCEYCRMPQSASRLVLVLDHIVAKQHKGKTVSANLALCCGHCNLHKGPNLAGIDPRSNKMSRLFHPRRDIWARDFAWKGAILVGVTAVGRATIEVPAMNNDDQQSMRRTLLDEGVFPF